MQANPFAHQGQSKCSDIPLVTESEKIMRKLLGDRFVKFENGSTPLRFATVDEFNNIALAMLGREGCIATWQDLPESAGQDGPCSS